MGGRPASGLVSCFPAQWPHLVTEGSEPRSQQSFPCHRLVGLSPSFLYVSFWLTLLSTYSAPGIVSIFFDPHNNPMKVSAPILQTRNQAQGPEGPAQGAAAVSVSARTPQCGGRAFALPQLPWAPRATPRGSSCLEKGVLGDREGLHRGGALLSAGVCRPGPSPSFRAEPMSFPSPWSGGRRKRQAALREE